MPKKSKYSEEYQAGVVARAVRGEDLNSVANEAGITVRTIQRWIKAAREIKASKRPEPKPPAPEIAAKIFKTPKSREIEESWLSAGAPDIVVLIATEGIDAPDGSGAPTKREGLVRCRQYEVLYQRWTDESISPTGLASILKQYEIMVSTDRARYAEPARRIIGLTEEWPPKPRIVEARTDVPAKIQSEIKEPKIIERTG